MYLASIITIALKCQSIEKAFTSLTRASTGQVCHWMSLKVVRKLFRLQQTYVLESVKCSRTCMIDHFTRKTYTCTIWLQTAHWCVLMTIASVPHLFDLWNAVIYVYMCYDVYIQGCLHIIIIFSYIVSTIHDRVYPRVYPRWNISDIDRRLILIHIRIGMGPIRFACCSQGMFQ